MKDYLTINETAQELGKHWQTIRNWVITGKIPAIKVGMQWRIKKSEVEQIKRLGLHL